MFHPTANQKSTSRFVQHFIKVQIGGIDFNIGLRIEVILELKSKKKFKPNVIELNGRIEDDLSIVSKLLPIYFSDTESEPIESLRKEKRYSSIRKFHVFISNHNHTRVCKNCLASFDDEYRLLKHQFTCLTDDPCILKKSYRRLVILHAKKLKDTCAN